MALVAGGAFIAYAEHDVATLPLLGSWLVTLHGWQTVFILAGLLGLPVAAAVLVLRDPRTGVVNNGTLAAALVATFKHLAEHRALFLPMLLGTTSLYILTSSNSAWIPSVFVRHFGWEPAQLGRTLGILIGLSAFSGNVSSGILSTWLMRRGFADAPLRTMLIAGSALVPVAVFSPLAQNPVFGLAGVIAVYMSTALTFGITTTAFVAVTPQHLRGQIVALYLMIGNLVGLGLGPPFVGALMDHGGPFFADIGHSLAFCCLIAGIPGILLFRRALPAFAAVADGVSRSPAVCRLVQ